MSNGKNAYLMEERSSNSPRLVENLRFSREAFIKLCLQEHIPMPKQWQALANEMAEKERERRFPNRCSVQEACVLMAGDELDTAEKYDTGDIRFTAEQNALYENLTKKIQKTDFSYSFDGEIWKNPGNVYEPYEAVFSRETYWKWFKENPMGFNDPPWFNGLQIDHEKDEINLSGLSKNEDDLISYLKEWNPLIKKVIPIILIWRSRPDGERKTAKTLLDALNYAAKKDGWGTGNPVKLGEDRPLSKNQVLAIQTLLLPSDGGPGAGKKKSIDLEDAYKASCDAQNPKRKRKGVIDPK